MTFSAIIVAAGSGSRAGGDKQWRTVGDKPLIRWSAQSLLAAGANPLVLVLAEGAQDRAREALAGLDGWIAVTGGATRADSVQAGLAVLEDDRPVLIHDAARPFLKAHTIHALLDALADAEGALPALPVADSLRRGDADKLMGEVVDREGLYRAQTPQAFRPSTIRAAYAAWSQPDAPTDEASVVQAHGGRVRLVAGEADLFKLTYPEDFAMAERLIPSSERRVTRVGMGYDVHRWVEGDSVWLCGVEVPHTHTLLGHSDADAGLHALTDAILGAIAEGDIGDHFPPSDDRWKGASSDVFLAHAHELVKAKGGQIINVDLTLICEQPKVKPHRAAMRQRIADILGLDLSAVSVKATTTEGLGFTGRNEGLAAQAVCSIEMPA
ncbi:bifunctional 2-C-methyl-D-erythritol 4-phosphate cytidylyltransferase/2-C-methyl-D-erythritol 2,4-cyclodiphosphate synthase [Brevundimonas sp.]|uniref:bifunctional 2-C-methyl-D-erythritol 4-phosphate cytidylyltransferase/2-C-methyl-D-erythritol 2,4-cyclodiphosphate synthase n=3 Tax=Brevundimonas sp. TaxID=1871086 RepID=UPI002FCA0004